MLKYDLHISYQMFLLHQSQQNFLKRCAHTVEKELSSGLFIFASLDNFELCIFDPSKRKFLHVKAYLLTLTIKDDQLLCTDFVSFGQSRLDTGKCFIATDLRSDLFSIENDCNYTLKVKEASSAFLLYLIVLNDLNQILQKVESHPTEFGIVVGVSFFEGCF